MISGKKFKHINLEVFSPDWGSDLATTIIDLEKLRVTPLGGPVPPYIFFQLKNIFQFLESIGSARIEGNRTTLVEFVEGIIKDPEKETQDQQMREVFNIEDTIDFIERTVTGKTKFDRFLISEIHRKITAGLDIPPRGEGSVSPGSLRKINVEIKGSDHIPPESIKVQDYFDELLDFINKDVTNQFHLLIMAIAHHRLAWIHPFDNGNGRLVRMVTYALLIKQGFRVDNGRILNPTAVFCMDREKYYYMLSKADSGQKKDVLEWCSYVLKGLLDEIEKIDKLLNIDFVVNEILIPTLKFALEEKHITHREYLILNAIVQKENMSLKSFELVKIINEESPQQRSRIIRRLREKKMVMPIEKNGRIYTIRFDNNYLLRGIIRKLEDNSFIPNFLNTAT